MSDVLSGLTDVPVKLDDDTEVRVVARNVGGPQKVGITKSQSFAKVMSDISSVSSAFQKSIVSVQPSKATIAFGVELAVKSGELTALLFDSSGKSSLTVTLEWNNDCDKTER